MRGMRRSVRLWKHFSKCSCPVNLGDHCHLGGECDVGALGGGDGVANAQEHVA